MALRALRLGVRPSVVMLQQNLGHVQNKPNSPYFCFQLFYCFDVNILTVCCFFGHEVY